MKKIAVVYWSGTGNTEAMANAVAEGIKEAGNQVEMYFPSDFKESMIADFDGFAFGCPAMGAEVLEEGEFEPMFSSCMEVLKGKNVGLFGSYGWGDGEWMRTWEDDCLSNGISLVSDCVICNEYPDEDGILECKKLGAAL